MTNPGLAILPVTVTNPVRVPTVVGSNLTEMSQLPWFDRVAGQLCVKLKGAEVLIDPSSKSANPTLTIRDVSVGLVVPNSRFANVRVSGTKDKLALGAAPDVPVPHRGNFAGATRFPDKLSSPGKLPEVSGLKVSCSWHELPVSKEAGQLCEAE